MSQRETNERRLRSQVTVRPAKRKTIKTQTMVARASFQAQRSRLQAAIQGAKIPARQKETNNVSPRHDNYLFLFFREFTSVVPLIT